MLCLAGLVYADEQHGYGATEGSILNVTSLRVDIRPCGKACLTITRRNQDGSGPPPQLLNPGDILGQWACSSKGDLNADQAVENSESAGLLAMLKPLGRPYSLEFFGLFMAVFFHRI